MSSQTQLKCSGEFSFLFFFKKNAAQEKLALVEFSLDYVFWGQGSKGRLALPSLADI